MVPQTAQQKTQGDLTGGTHRRVTPDWYGQAFNHVDPQAWLGDVLARIADHPVQKLDALLPWNWAAEREQHKLVA
jgi:hypothetical protein